MNKSQIRIFYRNQTRSSKKLPLSWVTNSKIKLLKKHILQAYFIKIKYL